MTLVWLLLLLLGLLLATWAAVLLFAAIAIIEGPDHCPRCGADLGITDHDRFNERFVDPRFGGANPRDSCRCGWRRERT